MADPFMQMHQQMQQMHQAMMSGVPMMSPFPDPYREAPRPQASQYQSRAPQVEVVDDDEPAHDGTGQGAIVEEPDEVPQPSRPSRRHRESDHHQHGRSQYGQAHMQPFHDPVQAMFPGFGGFGGFGGLMGMPAPSGSSTSYSYSSFSSSGGPGGATYQETKTHRVGPGGVSESKHTVRDHRTGEEKMRLSRGLRERKRTLEQARRNGQEVRRNVHLQGFARPEDAQHFDSEWQQAAVGLPGGASAPRSRPHTPQLEYHPRPHTGEHSAARRGDMHGFRDAAGQQYRGGSSVADARFRDM